MSHAPAAHAAGARPTWAVVATIRAPQEMVDVFISHYLALGADEVHVFFDDPAVVACAPALREDPRLIVRVCDAGLWRNRKSRYPLGGSGRPKNVEGRQFSNYLQVQAESRCDWILNVDVDELMVSARGIPEILAEVPDNVFMVGAKPLEAVYTDFPTLHDIFDAGYFKQCLKAFPEFVASEFSPELLPNEHGFWGHRKGKGFFRRAAKIMALSCHFPKPLDQSLVPKILHPEMELLHFECMTYELFHEKRARRISGDSLTTRIHPTTRARLDHFKATIEQGGEDATRRLYEQMNIFSGERLAKARDAGFLVERSRNGKAGSAPGDFELVHADGKALWVDVRKGIAVAASEGDGGDGTTLRRLRVSLEPTGSGVAYLYHASSGRRHFMMPDQRGNLVESGSDRAYFFKYKRHGAEGLHLYAPTPPVKNSYLVLRDDGRIGFDAVAPEPLANLLVSAIPDSGSDDGGTAPVFQEISRAVTAFLDGSDLSASLKKLWVYRGKCFVADFAHRGVGFNFDLTPDEGGMVSLDVVQRKPVAGVYATPTGARKTRIAAGVAIGEALHRMQANAAEICARVDAILDAEPRAATDMQGER